LEKANPDSLNSGAGGRGANRKPGPTSGAPGPARKLSRGWNRGYDIQNRKKNGGGEGKGHDDPGLRLLGKRRGDLPRGRRRSSVLGMARAVKSFPAGDSRGPNRGGLAAPTARGKTAGKSLHARGLTKPRASASESPLPCGGLGDEGGPGVGDDRRGKIREGKRLWLRVQKKK